MRRAILAVAWCLVLAGLGGCGLPGGGNVEQVPSADVPYGLLAPDRPDPAPGTPSTSPTAPHVYWLQEDGLLQSVATPPLGDDAPTALAALFDVLAGGPDDGQQEAGLSSALGTGVDIVLVDLDDGTASIEVDFGAQEPSPDRLPTAIGQLVLSAVTSPGVSQVQFVQGSEVVSVPLPSGVLDDGPLAGSDYDSLVATG